MESILSTPGQFEGPSLVSQIIANKVNVSGIDQDRNIGLVQQILDKGREVMHPIVVELAVDSEVARFPTMNVVGVDAQGFHSRVLIEPGLNGRKVVTERRLFALLTNIVRIQSGHLVGTGQSNVADNKSRLAGEIINGRITSVALMNELLAFRNNSLHGLVGRFVDDLDVVRVVVDHFRVVGILSFGVSKSISNTESAERQVDGGSVLGDRLVSTPDAMSNGRSVVS